MSKVKKVFLSVVTAGFCGGLVTLAPSVKAGDISFSAGGSAKGDSGGVTATGSSEGSAQGSDLYQPTMKSGISFSKIGNSRHSPLADAAKNRQSISISADPKAAVREAKAQQSVKKVYRVKEGDTLWDICETNFGDSYVWPRIWSYNPGITNPNWIYPGDTLMLVPPMAQTALDQSDNKGKKQTMLMEPSHNDALLIRNRGFVDKKVLDQSGIVRGAQKEIEMLSQWDEAYVEFKKNKDIQVGDEFAAFKILKDVDSVDDRGTELGKLVEILGAVRVTSFDKENKIARVVIDESMKVITRGTLIGPIHRRFELVDSKTNSAELKGHIVAHLDHTLMFSSQQIVFVDKGSKDGVREGNRFFSLRKRDEYRASRNEDDDNEHYPFEVLAEMRVIEARPHTSTCIITAATRVLQDGAPVEMVKGY